ncbi:MAG: DUF4040 domain-containing protein [Defluviitaleaceae bacterium]|nr:DUF4040 domain-containing protein [Defluviitaleaceae bacterium]
MYDWIYLLVVLLFGSFALIIAEKRVYRLVIYTGIFSIFVSAIYLFLGSPDVAMAEIAIGAYAVIFFIVAAEKYYGKAARNARITNPIKENKGKEAAKAVGSIVLIGVVGVLFLQFLPSSESNFYLRDQFLLNAGDDVGGYNVIGAILMGYRLYDTLFEALLLVIAIMAVGHLSWFEGDYVKKGKRSEILQDKVAFYSIRLITPLILIFGIYLVANGHISAGGGFQGGVAIACFFVCRYMIHNIYDMPVKKVLKLEEIVFVALTVVAIFTVFVDTSSLVDYEYRTLFQTIHLMSANALVGLKVSCGFFILFYRYITIERM